MIEMNLRELLKNVDIKEMKGSDNVRVKGISKDSREVSDGYLFFMTKKNRIYLQEVKNKGVKVVITDIDEDLSSVPCVVKVPDVEKVMGQIASTFYGEPSKDIFITGITGTNGKTTTCFLIDSILQTAGTKQAIIGTIFYRYNGYVIKAENTTPGAIELQRILRQMKDAGVTHLTMEVSSHSLEQKRVEGVNFDICIFTNLSHDHLDYHGEFSAYRNAKALLFQYYLEKSSKPEKTAILNGDDPNVSYMIPESKNVKIFYYGFTNEYHAKLVRYNQNIDGMEIEFSLFGEKIKLKSRLIGNFNIYNILAASLACKIMGMEPDLIKKGIENFHGVPGRLERVINQKGYQIFIDYAHTPDALKNVLNVLSDLKRGRLLVVFGCGGDRDRQKRPVMGRIASTLADFSIITSDNPRSEDPNQIIEEIKKGIVGENYKVVIDRKEAIYEAIKMMNSDDILLIAGKGHEDYQIIGGKIIRFNDREVAEEILSVAL
ncbi:MAG: UDP-N-acetylmuramoyl-L-alanyl-D-glutamate--2,6-diaminopimelate ligase [Deltaproteobacteria bacterium]|nr:UDP-N-acetylmuramoyl-L-alanyl-D-glutamate--2,6-diaminopimelate ligase [Deltaproteobacteria bacterium]